jgi:hypothetical protein
MGGQNILHTPYQSGEAFLHITWNFYRITGQHLSQWDEPFNQATFFNYDTTTAVVVNEVFTIPPATAANQPSYLEISGNTREVNDTNFKFDFGGSTSVNLVIVYSQYAGVTKESRHGNSRR